MLNDNSNENSTVSGIR